MNYGIGIDLGGTNVKAVAMAASGEVLERASVPSGDGDGSPINTWAGRARDLVRQFEKARGAAADWIGIAAPGVPARDGRTVAHQPGKLHGLEGFDWTAFLGRKELVPVLNDAHAALLAEARFGAAKGFRNVILLTLGTGVGGAIMLDGKLFTGTIGRAGHVGHLSVTGDDERSIFGVPGTLERAIGNYSLAERTGGKFSSTRELVEAQCAGDARAAQAWRKSINTLARALVSLANVLDPEAIVIGGGIARAGDELFGPLRSEMDAMEWRPGGQAVRILPAALGDWAGALGAAQYALELARTGG
jgi:glucokinase